ncbi:MAG: STAS domain-containing protein [Burkholderiaceae bacterium]
MQEILLSLSERVGLSTVMRELDQQLDHLQQAWPDSRPDTASCRVVVDLGGLHQVDTSVLALILQLDRQVRTHTAQPLRIRSAPQALRALARLTSLSSVLEWE